MNQMCYTDTGKFNVIIYNYLISNDMAIHDCIKKLFRDRLLEMFKRYYADKCEFYTFFTILFKIFTQFLLSEFIDM